MRFGNTRESKNFQDLTGLPKMMTMLFSTLNREDQRIQDQMDDARDYGGYESWLNKYLSSLSPQEQEDIKNRGLTPLDIYNLRALRHGHPFLDPTSVPYKKLPGKYGY